MKYAIVTGTMIAVVAGVTGYFVVLRRSAFTAHAFSEIGFAGASGAILLGIPPIGGLLLGSIIGGATIAALGSGVTNRDTQIGIVLRVLSRDWVYSSSTSTMLLPRRRSPSSLGDTRISFGEVVLTHPCWSRDSSGCGFPLSAAPLRIAG